MNKTALITSVASIALLLASAAPALADDSIQVSASTTTHVGEDQGDAQGDSHGSLDLPKVRLMASTTAHVQKEDMKNASSTQKRMQKADDKAGQAIDKRIKSLQELLTRLGNLKSLSADTLASIKASLTAEIQVLTDLKAKIASDTATTTIKADADAITKANRVYLLVEPKARIASAASRVNAVVTQFQALAVKLQARLTAAQVAGADITVASAALTDFNLKIADAKTNADAAVAETANLQADNGNATVLAANLAALKDARAKLDVAQKDIVVARQDAAKIYGVVKGKEGKGEGDIHANATTTASTTVETH
jgi:DNA repair exonuclease SbcCD ATPase subunit